VSTHLAVIILIVLIILTSSGVSHNPVVMFYMAYALTLKEELRFDCFVCKVRDEVEVTVEHRLHFLQVRNESEEEVDHRVYHTT
jgi:hypothetical protein